ncbi:hypothetical protein BaRGS_00036088 [Batillaria attramentaria]|uniref:SOCS box domain-containing protein n=1 Tax=Batillaria attramentaria TaxID=370345 RepID=A0ABD0JCS5_9CAEN
MDRCQDQILLCKTARDAAIHRKWKLVKSLLVKCSKGTGGTFFSDILKSAIGNGESECVQLVLEKTDPTSAYSGSRTILFDAVTSSEDREGMLRLCVRSGVSTLQRSLETGHYSPMKRALQNGQLPLVRLLHESGSSSNHELFLLKNDASIRTQLERQRRQDIVQYVDQAASNPASLQHLCRLIISHLAGCRPGRRDRVASLPVPWCVQEFLSFADF